MRTVTPRCLFACQYPCHASVTKNLHYPRSERHSAIPAQ